MQKTYTIARFAKPLNVMVPVLSDWKAHLMTLAKAERHTADMRLAGFDVVVVNTQAE